MKIIIEYHELVELVIAKVKEDTGVTVRKQDIILYDTDPEDVRGAM